MAEERLIDDDKDRKYRIRKNENGEEELVIIDEPEEEEELPEFGVVTAEDEELSKEQLEEKTVQRREAAQRKVAALKEDARRKIEEGDFESAQYCLSQAAELTEYDGELYYLQLKAYSRGMTSFLDLQKCVDAADGVKEYSTKEQKEELSSLSAPLTARIDEFKAQCGKLSEENENGKAERRETFVKGRNRAFGWLVCTAVPFIALFIAAMVSVSKMDVEDTFVILTIVFSIASAVAFFAVVFTFYRFWTANKRVKLNESDTATKIGREFLSCKEELERLQSIYQSIQNDLS